MSFRSEIRSLPDARTKTGRVVRVENGLVDVITTGGNAVLKGIRCSGATPNAGDSVMVTFYRNNEITATAISSKDGEGGTTILNVENFTTINGGGGGSGSVTSVGLTMPDGFSVSGSPITSSGTLAVGFAARNQNAVLAGPASGGAGAPTWRALTLADLPAVGSVTSVGLTAPSGFTVSGSPVTSSGTLAIAFASQAQNVVLAGPAAGGAGAPTWRALAPGDLPAGGDLTGTTNQVSVTGGSGAVLGSGVVLSLPQNIHTGANPTFNKLTLNGPLWIGQAGASRLPDATGNVEIAGTLSIAGTKFGNLDLWSGGLTAGSDYIGGENAATRTNSTSKFGAFTAPHYTLLEENLLVISALSDSANNTISYGGGEDRANAATIHNWFTAANNITTDGNLAASLTNSSFSVFSPTTIRAASAYQASFEYNASNWSRLSVDSSGNVNWNYSSVAPKTDFGYSNFVLREIDPPAALTATDQAVAGNLNGSYLYKVTLVTVQGETNVLSGTSASVSVVNSRMSLTNIPIGPSGVISRKIYRTAAGGQVYKLVATINDNVTTTYSDNVADASLGAKIPYRNTTGGQFFTGSNGATWVMGLHTAGLHVNTLSIGPGSYPGQQGLCIPYDQYVQCMNSTGDGLINIFSVGASGITWGSGFSMGNQSIGNLYGINFYAIGRISNNAGGGAYDFEFNNSTGGTAKLKWYGAGTGWHVNFLDNASGGYAGFGLNLTPTSRVHVDGSFARTAAAKSANFTADAAASAYYVTTGSSANIVATLPAASTCNGREYIFVKVDNGNKDIVITRAGSDTINGATTKNVGTTQYATVTIKSDGGTNWYVI